MGAQQHVKLNANRVAALIRVRDGGPGAWCDGFGRAGGAVSRMFDDMTAQGLVSGPPYHVTAKGLQAIIDWEAQHGNSKNHR